MFKKPILTLALASMTFLITLIFGITYFGQEDMETLQGSLYNPVTRVEPEAYSADFAATYKLAKDVVFGKQGDWSFCDYEMPADPFFSTELVWATINDDKPIEAGEVFTVDIELKNTGNTRLYSANGRRCSGLPKFRLGTALEQDRESVFGIDDYSISGWRSAQRIKMLEDYVEPGENLHFVFQSIAPPGTNIYREFFKPVVEGVTWLDDDNLLALDIKVGEFTKEMTDNIRFVSNVSVDAKALEGKERRLEIDLATQTMYAKYEDLVVWEMPISSGAYATPTPPGNYNIFQKQELRIGGAPPHYRMPWWQFWDKRGYGIHELPYLGDNNGGEFWREAQDHIGIPVSHGCIRTLPGDAETLYQFTIIGTPLWVHR
jgi:hypothetical protein